MFKKYERFRKTRGVTQANGYFRGNLLIKYKQCQFGLSAKIRSTTFGNPRKFCEPFKERKKNKLRYGLVYIL